MPSTFPTEAAPAGRPRRWRRALSRAGFAIAVLITVVVVFEVVESVRGNAAWRRYEREARARGVKLTMPEYVQPPVPDERNFAAIPVFQDTFRQPQPPNPFTLPDAFTKKPTADVLFKNQQIDLVALQKALVETKTIEAAGESPARDVLKALEKFDPVLAQLRDAAARPECRFPVRYEDGIATALPHLSLFNSATKIYGLRLSAHLALGESDAALKDFHGAFRLYTALIHEPTLIAGLVRLSVLSSTEYAVWGGVTRHQWNDAALEKIGTELARVRLMDDCALAFGSERGFANMLSEQLVTQGSRALAPLLTTNNGNGVTALGQQMLVALYPTGWIRMSQVRENQYLDETLARVSQEPPRVFLDRAVLSLAPEMSQAGFIERIIYLPFFLIAPGLEGVLQNYAFGQTLLDETRIACALERHRLAHGSYPESLAALAPAFLPAIPADVMTGEPLHYRAESGGCTIYSVGSNLQDDGGKFDAKTSAKQQADWVMILGGK